MSSHGAANGHSHAHNHTHTHAAAGGAATGAAGAGGHGAAGGAGAHNHGTAGTHTHGAGGAAGAAGGAHGMTTNPALNAFMNAYNLTAVHLTPEMLSLASAMLGYGPVSHNTPPSSPPQSGAGTGAPATGAAAGAGTGTAATGAGATTAGTGAAATGAGATAAGAAAGTAAASAGAAAGTAGAAPAAGAGGLGGLSAHTLSFFSDLGIDLTGPPPSLEPKKVFKRPRTLEMLAHHRDWPLRLPSTFVCETEFHFDDLMLIAAKGIEMQQVWCPECGEELDPKVNRDPLDATGDSLLCWHCEHIFTDDALSNDELYASLSHLLRREDWRKYVSATITHAFHYPEHVLEAFITSVKGAMRPDWWPFKPQPGAANAKVPPPRFLLQEPLRWKMQDCPIRKITIDTADNLGKHMPALSAIVSGMPSLISFGLPGNDIPNKPPPEKELIEFAKSFRKSNVRNLDLTWSSTRTPNCCTVLRTIGTLLEHLDSLTLRQFCISFIGGEYDMLGDADNDRYMLLVARFLRRSIQTDTYKHPVVMVDPTRYGAPNLVTFEFSQGLYPYNHTRTIAAAITGTVRPPHVTPMMEDIDRMSKVKVRRVDLRAGVVLPANRGLTLSERLVRYDLSDVSLMRAGEALKETDAMLVFHPSMTRDNTGLSERVLSATRAQARAFRSVVNKIKADEADSLALQRMVANGAHLRKLMNASFKILRAARILGCAVVGPKTSDKRSLWLGLPAEIRNHIVRFCDRDAMLSPSQFQAVLSYACDRRTIGYGRVSELNVFERRLGEEARDEAKGPQNSLRALLPIFDAKPWSWHNNMAVCLPADWCAIWGGLIYTERHKTVCKSPTAMAFIFATGCAVPRGRDPGDKAAAPRKKKR